MVHGHSSSSLRHWRTIIQNRALALSQPWRNLSSPYCLHRGAKADADTNIVKLPVVWNDVPKENHQQCNINVYIHKTQKAIAANSWKLPLCWLHDNCRQLRRINKESCTKAKTRDQKLEARQNIWFLPDKPINLKPTDHHLPTLIKSTS